MQISRFLAGLTAAIIGLVSAPALAQAAVVLADVAPSAASTPGAWESLGMGGAALAWAAWSVREANLARLKEADRYAADLKVLAERYAADIRALGEQRLQDARDYSEQADRIYGSKAGVHDAMLQLYERELAWMRSLHQHKGPREGPSAVPGGQAA